MHKPNSRTLASVAGAVCAVVFSISSADAAGGAYVVDDAIIDDVGACKVESWIALASNSDLAAVSTPACVVPLFLPTELGLQAARTRTDGEWGTSLTPKFKTTLVKPDVGKFGIAVSGGATFDAMTGAYASAFINIPVTFQATETLKLNVNAGWLYDAINAIDYATYGAGFEWQPKKDGLLTFIAEVFGIAGDRGDAARSLIEPRFQAGVRFTPIETLDLDLVYGRNIAGENANWITVGLNVRFPPPKKEGK
jgi:hypothetical protein